MRHSHKPYRVIVYREQARLPHENLVHSMIYMQCEELPKAAIAVYQFKRFAAFGSSYKMRIFRLRNF